MKVARPLLIDNPSKTRLRGDTRFAILCNERSAKALTVTVPARVQRGNRKPFLGSSVNHTGAVERPFGVVSEVRPIESDQAFEQHTERLRIITPLSGRMKNVRQTKRNVHYAIAPIQTKPSCISALSVYASAPSAASRMR